MVVSLEAIFLSIFVLMAQKRESAIAELREELALQVNLRIEEEMTKTLQLVAGLYTRLGHRVAEDPELHRHDAAARRGGTRARAVSRRSPRRRRFGTQAGGVEMGARRSTEATKRSGWRRRMDEPSQLDSPFKIS